MTLTELQDKLGEQINLITNPDTPYEEKRRLAEVAQTVSSLAKQMINNADVILRTEKLVAEGKLQETSAITKMVQRGETQK